jgi:hypothetical protein
MQATEMARVAECDRLPQKAKATHTHATCTHLVLRHSHCQLLLLRLPIFLLLTGAV